MNFEEYYNLIKEDPDSVNFSIDDSRIRLRWDMPSANPFGFINKDASFEYDGISYNFFNNINISKEVLIGGSRETHGDIVHSYISGIDHGYVYVIDVYGDKLIKLFLSNKDLKDEIFKNRIRYRFPISSHKILVPCGRIWTGLVHNGRAFNFISFWGSDIEITHKHVEVVLDFFDIPETEYNSVYVELIHEYDTGKRLTFSEIRDSISKSYEKQKKFKSNAEDAHLAAGFGAAFKDKGGMGSIADGKKANRAGFDNVSKYKDVRFPYRESIKHH